MLLEEICVSVGILLLGLIAFLAVKSGKKRSKSISEYQRKEIKKQYFLCFDPYEKTDHTKTF